MFLVAIAKIYEVVIIKNGDKICKRIEAIHGKLFVEDPLMEHTFQSLFLASMLQTITIGKQFIQFYKVKFFGYFDIGWVGSMHDANSKECNAVRQFLRLWKFTKYPLIGDAIYLC